MMPEECSAFADGVTDEFAELDDDEFPTEPDELAEDPCGVVATVPFATPPFASVMEWVKLVGLLIGPQ